MITLGNGLKFNPLSIFSRTEMVEGIQREVFEIRIKESDMTLEAVNALYKNTDQFDEITITEETKTDEGVQTSSFVYLHYIIPVSLSLKTIDGISTYSLTIAKMTTLEIKQKELEDELITTQLALTELAESM